MHWTKKNIALVLFYVLSHYGLLVIYYFIGSCFLYFGISLSPLFRVLLFFFALQPIALLVLLGKKNVRLFTLGNILMSWWLTLVVMATSITIMLSLCFPQVRTFSATKANTLLIPLFTRGDSRTRLDFYVFKNHPERAWFETNYLPVLTNTMQNYEIRITYLDEDTHTKRWEMIRQWEEIDGISNLYLVVNMDEVFTGKKSFECFLARENKNKQGLP